MVLFGKRYLMAPGPTAVPEDVLLEAARPIMHHRTPDFSGILWAVSNDLKKIFKTEQPVYILASSGTGAMEFALVNTCSVGDKVLIVVGGKFGERWFEMARAYGLDTVVYEIEWGSAPLPEEIDRYLKEHPDIKAVFTTLFETSTGTVYDIEAIARCVQESNAILVVDAVSGMAACDLQMDNWGVDVVVASSQKAFMLPPGLSFVAFSEKASKLVGKSDLPSYYFSALDYKKAYFSNTTPYTPAVSLIVQLRKALSVMLEEGIDNVIRRHALLAEATRMGVKAIGLELFSSNPGNVCTAVKIPTGIDGVKLLSRIRDVYKVTISGGQGKLKGKILRIAHLGYAYAFDVVIAISALEMALKDEGYPVELGRGVGAAELILREGK